MRKLISLSALGFAFAILSSPTIGLAQTTDANVCAIMAGKITPDISIQTTSADSFSVFQQLIRDQRFQSFATANSTNLDIGLSVVDYVDAFLGTTSSSSSWSTNWQNFIQATYSQASSTFNKTKFQSSWSPDLISAIAACNPSFYGILSVVSVNHDAFTIKLHGIGQWQLLGIAATPKDPSFSCSGDELAASDHPINFTNDHLLQCVKNPNTTILVSIHDSQADVGPFTIYSVADDLRRQQDAQLAQMQADINTLRTQLSTVASNLNSASASLTAQIARSRSDLLQWPAGATQGDNAHPVCPTGQYAVGVSYLTESGLAHGAVYQIGVVCRTLNSATPLQ